jgi:hypothetical protein
VARWRGRGAGRRHRDRDRGLPGTNRPRLVDVSRADAPAEIIAEARIPLGGQQPPVSFALTYDAVRIDARFTYAVQARIEVDGQLWFVSTDRYPVITRGNPDRAEIIVRRVASGVGPAGPGSGVPAGGQGGTGPTALPATGGGSAGGSAASAPTQALFLLLGVLLLGVATAVARRPARR